MMKRFGLMLVAVAAAVCAFAAAPNNSGTYYRNADGKKGAALKTALCGIIYNRTELTYKYLWTAYKSTDVRSDGKIWDMYSNVTNYEPGGTAQGANFHGEGDSYNREHSFPKSWFGGEVMPMYTDLHHLYPVDGYVNERRSNYPFGETNGETYKTANDFSKLGNCTYNGYTGKVFEPADEYKGDFARTYFYMVTCYEEKLNDWVTNFGSTTEVDVVLDGSTYPGLTSWQLAMFLSWAAADPVSDKEVARNNAVASIQGNRNPFIDYPGLEEYIWGTKTNEAFSYDNYVNPDGTQQGGEQEQEVADALTVAGWANYSTNAYSAAGADQTGTSGSTGVSYAMQVYNGSTGAVRGNQSGTGNFSCRNTTAYDGYYIKEVKLTVTGGTIDGSTNGRSVVYFGTSAFSVPPTGTATASNENASGQTTLTWTNTDKTKNYFVLYNLKTSDTAKAAVVTVTWAAVSVLANVPVTYAQTTTVPYGETFTLENGTHFTTDGTVTLTSSNQAVATVSGLTVTPVAAGTCTISVNYGGTTNYNAATSQFTFNVAQPMGGITAKPSSEDVVLFHETFGATDNSRAWNDSYSVKSGVSEVYSGITGYTVTNAKQSKNTMGQTASALFSNQGATGSLIIGPLNVSGYSGLSVSNYFGMSSGTWNEGSFMRLSYSTNGTSYTEVSRTDSNTPSGAVGSNNNFVQATYDLPDDALSSTLYLKFEAYVYQVNKNGMEIGQAYIDEVEVSTPAPGTESITLNSNGYATFCSEYPLDFSDYATADYSAWTVTGVSGTTISFARVTGSVAGGTGLLLKGESGATITLNTTNSTNEVESNRLYGTLAPEYINANAFYGLSGNKFVRVNAGTVPAHKALLPAILVNNNANVKSFTFVFNDDLATGVEKVNENVNDNLNLNDNIYDLSGRRIDGSRFMVNGSKLPKGIYIINGRKVLVK